jgi:hypothetical protein
MDESTPSTPQERVNQSLKQLADWQLKVKVMNFCDAAVQLGFTQEQIENMVKKLPKRQ